MKHFKLYNNLLGWLVFAVAAATYLLTMEPTASFWDCGEYISSAYKFDVGHPPGNPFFLMVGHFFSLFASDQSHVAMMVNASSAIASAFTILFLFWTITALARKLIVPMSGAKSSSEAVKEMTISQGLGVLGAGAVGALAYTFSDSFWFNAVEGEVYALSSFFTAIVFWLVFKWEEQAEESQSDRWLILIAYLMGLSIGVHLLNLLTIPAIVLVYYFKKYTFSWKGVFWAMVVSVGILGVILYGMIPGFVQVACWFELLFVNTLHYPFNTGVIIYILLALGILIWAIVETARGTNKLRMIVSFVLAVTAVGIPFFGESVWIGLLVITALFTVLYVKQNQISSRMLNTSVLMITVILLGYSSYASVVIRSSADTPMDQNSPDNVFSLKSYLNREQYGDRPLFYGAVYNAPVKLDIVGNMCIPVEKHGSKSYAPAPKKEGENYQDHYICTGEKTSYVMDEKFNMFFPRMYSSQPTHISAYKEWGEIRGRKVRYDYCGQKKSDMKPTFAENMRFFFRYQVNFMYWRYFMWNFSGRQNDLQGYGEIDKGNWITGIPFIDNKLVGDQKNLPDELKNNKGHNVYYMLPLLLGIIGLLFQLGKKRAGYENFTIVFLLFFLTGLAIVLYLNQTPYQPRERDYSYAGSFYAFCIWIGLGVLAISEWLNSLLKSDNQIIKSAVATIVALICLCVPALMAQQNWDDHDRSDRYSCRDFGANYLKSCQKNSIIFSNGDNDTFPLWYNQEVEGVGTDIRVCNLSYLQTDWYIDQLRRPYYESDAAPISWEPEDYISGKNEVVWVNNKMHQPMDVKLAYDFVKSDDPKTQENGDNYIPTDELYVPVDWSNVMKSPAFMVDGKCKYAPEQLAKRVDIKLKRRLTKSELMVLEMIRTGEWQRPLYFAVTVGGDYYQGLEKYFELTGMAYQITPVASADGQPRVNTDLMYDNMMHKFAYGNMNQPGIYIDENLARMCRTHRMMFSTLAEALIREGKRDRAMEVLDYAEEVLPGYNLSYDYTSANMAAYYYFLDAKEKATPIMDAVADGCVQYLAWGTKLRPAMRKSLQSTLGQKMAILNYVIHQAEAHKDAAIVDKYRPLFEQYSKVVE